MFDQAAAAATISDITRDLGRIGDTLAWLAPCAYEQRAGATGHSVICGTCGGSGRTETGEPCNDCVIALLGDVGEIVIRRHELARVLDDAAKDLERIWKITGDLRDHTAALAQVIDRGASTLPGITPPTVDPREVAEQVRRAEGRTRRGEQPAPEPTMAQAAAKLLAEHVARQERIDAERAKREREGVKVRNRWEH